jgi:hypothetical protein
VAAKAASGDGRSGWSTRRRSVDRGVVMGSTKSRTRSGSLWHWARRGYRRARGGRCTWARKTMARSRSESHGRCVVVKKIAVQAVTMVRIRAGGCCEGEEGKLASPLDHDSMSIRARGGGTRGGSGGPTAAVAGDWRGEAVTRPRQHGHACARSDRGVR